MQKRQTDINEAMVLIDTCIAQVQELRTDKTFCEISDACNELNNGAEPPAKWRRDVGMPRHLEGYAISSRTGHVDETITRPLLYEVVDNVLAELQHRFADSGWIYKAVTAMSRKSKNFLDSKTLAPLSRLGIVIPSDAELQVCKAYIERLQCPVEENDSNKVLQILYDQRAAFKDTYEMAAAIGTLGSSTAVCEANFSTMSRINKPHRRSMTHLRQLNLVLSI